MFKYGGPIKEGIMHGVRSNYAGGQRVGAFNVGSPVKGMFPKDVTGREHHVAPAIGAGIWYGAQGLARMAPMLYRAITGAKNISKAGNIVKNVGGAGSGTGWSTIPRSRVGKEIMNIPQAAKGGSGILNKVKNWFKADPLYSSVAGGTTMLGRGLKTGGKKIGQFAKYSTTTPSGLAFFGIPVVYAGGKYILSSTGEELNNDQINQLTQTPQDGVPGGGDQGMQGTGEWFAAEAQKKLAAKAKADRKAKLTKYLDTMGYDKAKKTAIGDALIDASAIVQQGTEEGGSLKHANWSKMINQAIQATSQRLKKPEQIREAVGLMMTKADIQKDMNADDKALAKLLTSKKIEKLNKELEGNSFRENLIAITQKMPGQAGFDAAAQVTEGVDFKGNLINATDWTESLKKMQEDPTSTGLNEKQLIKLYAEKEIAGKGYEDGDYTVGNNLVTIKDDIVVGVE